MSSKCEQAREGARKKLRNLRDLSDFCTEWDSIRKLISEQELLNSNLPSETREVVLLLAQFADKALLPTKSVSAVFGKEQNE